MKLKSVGSEQLKLLDYFLPSLSDGPYRAWASQEITVGEGDGQTEQVFRKETEFYVAGRAFTLQQDSVFSVYPCENAEGNFSNELPFIVLNRKSLPWQYDLGGRQMPWVALIVISSEEQAVERDMSVRELLTDPVGQGIYFPLQKQPEQYLENPEDVCHVVDLPREVYGKIMPSMEELPYLCHAKYVNLARTEEHVSGMDGYFSVVIGNRFLPSGNEEARKSTVHLVSMLGCEGAEASGCETIRLCSLYHWNVFSRSSQEAGFGELIAQIDCREFGRDDTENELLRRGVVAKEHRFRTGEVSGSLYSSPLLPARAPVCSMEGRRTADGHLIYDRELGVFDVRYASAWQLGRMLSLSDEAMAMKICQWRREMAAAAYRRRLKRNMEEQLPDFEEVCKKLREAFGGKEERT